VAVCNMIGLNSLLRGACHSGKPIAVATARFRFVRARPGLSPGRPCGRDNEGSFSADSIRH